MRLIDRKIGVILGACLLAAACESAEEKKARVAAETRTRVEAAEDAASAVAGVASPGVWTSEQVLKRLVDAGLAPQKRDSVRALPWMGVPVAAFRVGVATVDAYVFHDSLARAQVAARLDPVTLAPAGQASPWGTPHELVQNLNLLAVVVGGTDRQRDRIVTALAAGVGAP
jgi:hypothetical protein